VRITPRVHVIYAGSQTLHASLESERAWVVFEVILQDDVLLLQRETEDSASGADVAVVANELSVGAAG
jgi:hypothetical protein